MQRYYDSLYSNMNQVNLKQCWSAYRQRGRKMKSSDFDDFKDTQGKLINMVTETAPHMLDFVQKMTGH